MKKATVTADFNSSVQKVWGIVTDNHHAWRSDISKIEISDDGQTFTEYTRNDFPTTFIITSKTPYERYEFDMKNQNMAGHWTGIFLQAGNGTRIEFTEEVTVHNPIMNLFAGFYLKRQQAAYIKDLRKALGE